MNEHRVLAHLEDGLYVCDLCGDRNIPLGGKQRVDGWLHHLRLFHPGEWDGFQAAWERERSNGKGSH